MNKETENLVEAWDKVTRIFHWVSAAWVTGLIGLGLVMVHIVEHSGTKFELYQVHKSYGFIFGLFLIVRVTWRLRRTRPKILENSWMDKAAIANQALMLTILFLLVISGYALTSFSLLPIPIQIFDLQVPSLLKPNQAMEQTAILTHHTLAFVLVALVLAHVGAALFHHFVLKDKMLARMIRNQRD